MEREREKAGGYKANWLLEDLEAQNREVIGELETMLNVRLDASEVYRLVGRVIVKLHKQDLRVKEKNEHCLAGCSYFSLVIFGSDLSGQLRE